MPGNKRRVGSSIRPRTRNLPRIPLIHRPREERDERDELRPADRLERLALDLPPLLDFDERDERLDEREPAERDVLLRPPSLVRPSLERCLFTVAAAIRLAVLAERPRDDSLDLTCSYCRSSLADHALGICFSFLVAALRRGGRGAAPS